MFRIWAPNADKLRLETNNEQIRLVKCERGWWTAPVELEHGQDYSLAIDTKTGIPDPRSPWQPNGVHRASRHVDHSRFEWSDQCWQSRPLSSAIIYELHTGTFTPEGTFDAAIDRLDYLLDLGITHIELMPVAAFLGNRGWGYDGVSLYAPHQSYGGPDGLKRLVDACHARGLGIILDVVYNHLGPSGNYLPLFGPYFSQRHTTPWGDAVNFDGPYSDEVRRFFCDNALMWLRDYHFDGLRLDAVHAIVDTSAVPFLEQLAMEVEDLKAHLGRHVFLIAESDLNDPRIVRPRVTGGFGIDAQWSDDIHHAVHTVLTGERSGYYEDFGELEHLSTAMQQPYIYAGRRSPHRHRVHGRPPLGLDGRQFVAYLQNHDQLGNRAHGERIHQLTDIARAKIGAALILMSPYVPMLFQGEEWAASSPFLYFVDFADEPELAKAVAEGRCREFGAFGWNPDEIPNPTSESTFRRSKLNWDELTTEEHDDMLAWYKSLIRLRRNVPSLTTGRLETIAVEADCDGQYLCIERGPVRIYCNFSDHAISVGIAEVHPVILASDHNCKAEEGELELPAMCVAIVGELPESIASPDKELSTAAYAALYENGFADWSRWFEKPVVRH
jgi:maltooligosyltrehalose trehalohydrolase